MAELWITNATVATQDSARSARRANIRIIDGRIDGLTTRSPGRGAKELDASGLVIVPGFIQTHVHLCQTLFRNLADDLELLDWLSKRIWPFEAAHTKETLTVSALLGLHELISSGTTCILDMATVRHTEAVFEAVRASGIRANVGKCLMDHPTRTPAELRESTETALAEAKTLFERWNGAERDRIRASYAPRFVISCTEELMREVARLSAESGALIHTHASENRKEIEVVREISGLENIAYLDRLGLASDRLVLAHGVWLSDAEIDILSRTGTTITHCPGSNLKLASGIAPVPKLRSRGVNVALGADGAPCNNSLDIFGEMRLAATLHKPSGGPRTLRAQEAFDLATLGGARALHWSDDIGSIEIGKKADLVALDLERPENLLPVSRKPDPERIASAIVYATKPQHVRFTMVDGRVLYRNGRVVTIPLAPLIERARRAQRRFGRA